MEGEKEIGLLESIWDDNEDYCYLSVYKNKAQLQVQDEWRNVDILLS